MGEPDEPRLMIPYEFPLDGGVRARMRLPADLTEEDAERLCGMIRALAFTVDIRDALAPRQSP